MRAFQKYIGLLCSDQLLRSYGHKRYLGSVPIAAESTAVGPSMDPLVAAAEVAHGLGRRRSRVVGYSPGPGEQPTCLGCLLLSPSATSVTVARHGGQSQHRPSWAPRCTTAVGNRPMRSIPCQTCDVRPAMTYSVLKVPETLMPWLLMEPSRMASAAARPDSAKMLSARMRS